MRLDDRFYRLPFRFDAGRLVQEVEQFADSDWLAHPTRFAGNSALILLSAHGGINDDFAISGPMAPTDHLERCPYLRQVLASFEAPLSRSRLMRVAGGARVPEHVDAQYHWFRRVRVHVPVRTDPTVRFHCDGESVHMAAGEAWIFDTARLHRVENPSAAARIHLVFDTAGSESFWDVVRRSADAPDPTFIPFRPDADPALSIEPYRFQMLDPGEVDALTADIAAGLEASGDGVALDEHLRWFRSAWAEAFARHGHDAGGELTYRAVIARFADGMDGVGLDLRGRYAARVIRSALKTTNRAVGRPPLRAQRKAHARGADVEARYRPSAAVSIEPCSSGLRLHRSDSGASVSAPTRLVDVLATFHSGATPALAFERMSGGRGIAYDEFLKMVGQLVSLRFLTEVPTPPTFDRPVFVVSAPRAGGALLFETLSRCSEVWTLGAQVTDRFMPPERRNGADDDRLLPEDASRAVAGRVRESLAEALTDRESRTLLGLSQDERPGSVRLLDQDLRHGLRIHYLREIFPDALFVHVHRSPAESVASIVAGWRSGKFVTRSDLPGWPPRRWSFALPPGWASLAPDSLAEIAAYQWSAVNGLILDDLAALPASAHLSVSYADLVADPLGEIERVSRFAEWEVRDALTLPLPLSWGTLSAPCAQKWRAHEAEVLGVLSSTEDVEMRIARGALEATS